MQTKKQLPEHFAWCSEVVADLPVRDRLSKCPAFLRDLVSQAVTQLEPKTIWIFGSRSRQDHALLSDYDLAFDIPPGNGTAWNRFLDRQREERGTLLSIDLVLLDDVGDALREEILKSGVVLYEK